MYTSTGSALRVATRCLMRDSSVLSPDLILRVQPLFDLGQLTFKVGGFDSVQQVAPELPKCGSGPGVERLVPDTENAPPEKALHVTGRLQLLPLSYPLGGA